MRSRRRFLLHTATVGGAALVPSVLHAQRNELAALDHFVLQFLQDNNALGAALAVTAQSRLVYAKGFGFADMASNQPVRTESLFRIASISKAITGVAIMQLVERGLLALEAKVWELLRLDDPKDARWKLVTITQLLQHTSGWDREVFDPMFADARIARALKVALPIGVQHIIQYMLMQPLQYDPGSRWGYSNFAYCLLARVIEQVTGRGYEAHVRETVLTPLGITRMRLAMTIERAEGEVAYHADNDKTYPAVTGKIGEPVAFSNGGWRTENHAGGGAWLSSAVDLVRFAAAFDDPASCPILSVSTIATMFARPEGPAGEIVDGNYAGLGWFVWPEDRYAHRAHVSSNGLVDGTSTYLMRRHDGVNWVVLFNKRSTPDGKPLMMKFRDESAGVFNAIKRWPEGDFFSGLL